MNDGDHDVAPSSSLSLSVNSSSSGNKRQSSRWRWQSSIFIGSTLCCPLSLTFPRFSSLFPPLRQLRWPHEIYVQRQNLAAVCRRFVAIWRRSTINDLLNIHTTTKRFSSFSTVFFVVVFASFFFKLKTKVAVSRSVWPSFGLRKFMQSRNYFVFSPAASFLALQDALLWACFIYKVKYIYIFIEGISLRKLHARKRNTVVKVRRTDEGLMVCRWTKDAVIMYNQENCINRNTKLYYISNIIKYVLKGLLSNNVLFDILQYNNDVFIKSRVTSNRTPSIYPSPVKFSAFVLLRLSALWLSLLSYSIGIELLTFLAAPSPIYPLSSILDWFGSVWFGLAFRFSGESFAWGPPKRWHLMMNLTHKGTTTNHLLLVICQPPHTRNALHRGLSLKSDRWLISDTQRQSIQVVLLVPFILGLRFFSMFSYRSSLCNSHK